MMKTPEEIYREWSGESHNTNDCHPVHDSSTAIDFAQYYHNEMKQAEIVPDLSCATEDQKNLVIKELTETTAKAAMTVFIALGLKTHIEARLVNDATGDEFMFSLKKIN